MPFYDSSATCVKCCHCIPLRLGALLLVIVSILLRFLVFVALKLPWIWSAYEEQESVLDMMASTVDFSVTQMFGTVADFALLIGAIFKVQKCVRFYLATMFGIMAFEVLWFFVLVALGFPKAFAQWSIWTGVFHAWCWFTAHSWNQQWVV